VGVIAKHPTVSAAIDAARAAGAIALRYYRGGFDITIKPDQSPVTQADREAEQAITVMLGRAFPDHGFLGEEYGQQGPTDVRWIIDPIDGTRNFVRRIPIWAVLIALEEHGQVTAGVVHNPVTGELYWARRGEGAFANGEPIRVSACHRLEDAFLVHSALNLLRPTAYWDGFVRLVDRTSQQRGFGDYSGYGIVAEGKGDIYIEADLKPWDLAPMQVLIEEAGGRLTDFAGRRDIYTGTVVATNGLLHDEVLALLQPVP
jgi:histidinol-phosphatase